jgi:hypothetical protein
MTKKQSELSDFRIKNLEQRHNEMDQKISTILSNHLPHINIAIEKLNGNIDSTAKELNTKMNILSITNVSAIILGIVIVKFFQ